MSHRVLISTSSFGRVSARPLELLERAGVQVTLNPHGRKLSTAESMELLAEQDGVIAGSEALNREVISAAPRLRVISRVGTGVDNVDFDAARERGIPVFNTPDAHVAGVAELTVGGILSVLRGITRADRELRRGEWHKPMGRLLGARTVGVVGLGRVGRGVAELVAGFGSRVVAYDPEPDRSFAAERGIALLELDELLEQSEVVTLHLPYSDASRHLLDARRLDLLPHGAVVVNTARGGVLDEAALAERLRDGRLGGAYLDTFEEEPYDGPLTELDSVVLTPHIGSYAAEARERMETEAVENLLRFFDGEAG